MVICICGIAQALQYSAVIALVVMTAELSNYISMHHCENVVICETSGIKKDYF